MPTYSTAADVGRILRSSADGKIRLSTQALTSIVTQVSSTDRQPASLIMIDYQSIVISDGFQGKERLKFNFTTATDFTVYYVDTTQYRELLVGTGTISTEFVSPDGNFTFPAGLFSGTISVGNIVEFEFDAHISVDDVNSYIDEAEIEIDLALGVSRAGYLTGTKTRVFTALTVPQPISVATHYLAAYYVYTDVFRAKFKDEEQFGRNYSTRWKSRAEQLWGDFAKMSKRSIPRVYSFGSFIDKFGLDSVGPTPAGLLKTPADIARAANSNAIFEPDGIDEPT